MFVDNRILISAIRKRINGFKMSREEMDSFLIYLRKKVRGYIWNISNEQVEDFVQSIFMRLFCGGVNPDLNVCENIQSSYIEKNKEELSGMNNEDLWQRIFRHIIYLMDKQIPGKKRYTAEKSRRIETCAMSEISDSKNYF